MPTDSYLDTLSTNLTVIEQIYGLGTPTSDGLALKDLPTELLMSEINTSAINMPETHKSDINKEAGKAVIVLSYVSARLTFFNKKKLDYSNFPCMVDVANVLLIFVNKKSITSCPTAMSELNKIIAVLAAMDDISISNRNSLAYRFLRIFVVMILYGSFVNASVISDLILNQLIVKGG